MSRGSRLGSPALSIGSRIAAALALLALIALASTSRVGSGGRVAPLWLIVGLLALAAAIVVLLVFGSSTGSGYALLAETRLRTKLFVAAVALLLLTFVIAVTFTGSPPPKRTLHTRPAGHASQSWPGGALARRTTYEWAAALAGGALLAALVVLAAGIVVAERRRRRTPGEPIDQGDAVQQAVEESLDDLRRERDIRRAIIACYARMERAFERSGSARRPHEAPFEFLARVLARVAREPGRALTELFERAKFSREPMGATDKDQAIAALEALRSEVLA